MPEFMSHMGLVVDITPEHTAVVEVMREHACTGCAEHGSCSMQSANNVRVRFRNAFDLEKGDRVMIDIKKKDFFKSMLTVYIAPLFVMLFFAIITDSVQNSQPVTAAVTIASLIIYFVLLRLRHKGRDMQKYRKIS